MNSIFVFLKTQAQSYVDCCKTSDDYINIKEKNKDLYEFVLYNSSIKFYDYLLMNHSEFLYNLTIEDWLDILGNISQTMCKNDEEPLFLPTDFCKSQIINNWFNYQTHELNFEDPDEDDEKAKITISIVCEQDEYPIGTFYTEDLALYHLGDEYLKKSGCNDELIRHKMQIVLEYYMMHNDEIDYKYVINEIVKVYKSTTVTAIVVNEERFDIK